MENNLEDSLSQKEALLTKQNKIRHVQSHPSMATLPPGPGSRSLGSIPNTNIIPNSSSNGQGKNFSRTRLSLTASFQQVNSQKCVGVLTISALQ